MTIWAVVWNVLVCQHQEIFTAVGKSGTSGNSATAVWTHQAEDAALEKVIVADCLQPWHIAAEPLVQNRSSSEPGCVPPHV